MRILNRVTRFDSSQPDWPLGPNARPMKKNTKPADDDIRPEYDFSKGVRNKYAARYREGTNIVVLDPDVAAKFKDSESVNAALRSLLVREPRR